MALLPSAPRLTLLLVDDEQDILDAISPFLEKGIPGLGVVTAASGKAGLAILDGQPVDLIVSDFKMPGMDGLEFLEQCGLRHPCIPRAILTAFMAEEVERLAGPHAGIGAFLSKAAAPSVLLDWVRRRLESVPAAALASLAEVGITPPTAAPIT